MNRYSGCHAAHRAVRRRAHPSRAVGASVRRPAVASSFVLALMATGAVAVVENSPAGADPVTLALSSEVLAQTQEQARTGVEDATRIAGERSAVTAQAALTEGRASAAAKAKAEQVAKQRREAAQRAARAKQRTASIGKARKNPRAAAKAMLADQGFPASEWSCLDRLWVGESNWRHKAENPSSGAYGIPQALPARKMATVAKDWRDNPITQITWGLRYIKGTYGSPCAALGAWEGRSPHWY